MPPTTHCILLLSLLLSFPFSLFCRVSVIWSFSKHHRNSISILHSFLLLALVGIIALGGIFISFHSISSQLFSFFRTAALQVESNAFLFQNDLFLSTVPATLFSISRIPPIWHDSKHWFERLKLVPDTSYCDNCKGLRSFAGVGSDPTYTR